MKSLGLLVFQKNEASAVLTGLGLEVTKNGKVLEGAKQIECECCKKQLQVEKFGAVLPGSRYYYCDSPACLVDYVRRKLRSKPFTDRPQLDLGLMHR